LTPSPPSPLSVPAFTEVPTFDAISDLLCKVIKDARRIPCGNPSAWKPAVQNRWSIELTKLAGLFDRAVLNPSPLNLFTAVHNFVSAPGLVLAPFFSDIRHVDNNFDTVDSTVSASLRKVLKGQERKAMKLLCSNGVAKITPETIAALKDLHPQRTDELKLPSTQMPQLQINPKDVADSLFLDAGDFSLAKDVYGWAPWLFFSCRGAKLGFFRSFVIFACLLTNNASLFPTICSTLLSAGALTPLNKVPDEERKQREDAALPPKLRPINSGSLLAKTVLKAVLATPAAERAAERTAPFQLSMGASRGAEKLIHICRAAYENKWLVGKNDFTNGFNSMSRQKMLDSHCKLFPEVTKVFNFFYGTDSPVFLFDADNDVIILQSSQGSRQGCAAGTHGFCLGLHPMMHELQLLFPEFSLRVLTDDVNVFVPPPVSGSYADCQSTYSRYADFLVALKHLSFDFAGLSLNLDKAGLLLPVDAPLPSDEVRAKFPPLFDFQQEGFRVAGSPIGTDAFIQAFVNDKVKEAQSKIVSIKVLGLKSPRAAHRLLTCCASKLLSYLSATVPPNLMMPALLKFDAFIESAFFEILSPTPISCSADRMFRAKLKLRLPTPVGCGLFKSTDQGSFAWWSSVSSCLNDPLLFSLRSGLERFTTPAWHTMLETLGGHGSKLWSQVKHLLPANAAGLIDGSLYSPSASGKAKISKVALKLLSPVNIEQFRSLSSPSLLSDDGCLTPADVIQANSHSFAGRIFASSLKQTVPFAFSPSSYIAWCLFFLGLPPTSTLYNHELHEGYDYPVQRCLSKHGVHTVPFLDAGGCHASSGCPSTIGARSKKHTYLSRVVVQAAMEAGLNVRVEPATYDLLLGEFSRADCRRIFPKYASKVYQEKFQAIINALEVVSSPACTISAEEKAAYVQTRIDQLPLLKKHELKGLRIDAAIENPVTGETKWTDVSVTHTSAATYADSELKAVGHKINTSNIAATFELPDYLKVQPSPSLLKREAEKNFKYSRLITVAQKQTKEKKRLKCPTFTAFMVSDFGDLSPAALELQEWLVTAYAKKCERDGARADGCNSADMIRSFRQKFKLNVQLAIASGLGGMLLTAGQPFGHDVL
jgi:hypothetical protein